MQVCADKDVERAEGLAEADLGDRLAGGKDLRESGDRSTADAARQRAAGGIV